MVVRVEDESLIFDDPINDTDASTLSPKIDFNESIFSHDECRTSFGVTVNLHLKDTPTPLQTIPTTICWRENLFGMSSMSNKLKYYIGDIKSKRVRVFDEKDDDTCMDFKKQHMNCGVWRKDYHRQINREPLDHARSDYLISSR